MLKKRRFLLIVLSIFFVIGLGGCSFIATPVEYTSEQFLMDTIVNIKAYGDNEEQVKKAVLSAFAEMKRIERLTDRFAQEGTGEVEFSDVYRINQAAGEQPVKVNEDVYEMIEMAKTYYELTEGAFDITIGPVMDLWGFGSEEKYIPSDAELQGKMLSVNSDKVILNESEKTVFLQEDGMKIDLGAIAKGYATEKAAAVLLKTGIEHAIINAGGNIDVIGKKYDGQAWRIGIQDPRNSKNLVGILSLTDEAAVTSGDYQRYFEEDGIRYHHIISPKTGKPSRDTMSITVITKNSAKADVLSTALFVMGPEKGMELVEQLEGVEACFVGTDNKIVTSSGMSNKVEIQPSKEYTYDKNG